jgi:hypothetical protein
MKTIELPKNIEQAPPLTDEEVEPLIRKGIIKPLYRCYHPEAVKEMLLTGVLKPTQVPNIEAVPIKDRFGNVQWIVENPAERAQLYGEQFRLSEQGIVTDSYEFIGYPKPSDAVPWAKK